MNYSNGHQWGEKKLPRFPTDRGDLGSPDPQPGKPNNTLRESWQSIAIMYFNRDPANPVNYDISDDMILEYSRQFRELEDAIAEKLKMMRTWNQLADDYGQRYPTARIPKPQPHDHPNRPPHNNPAEQYFGIVWLAKPMNVGPSENACGCGCGCG